VGGFVGTSTIGITDSIFRLSKGHGIELEVGSGFSGFARNTFSDNDNYALRIGVEQRGIIDADTTFDGEGALAGIELMGGTVTSAQTWGDLKDDAVTSITDHFNVNTRLEIEPGVTLLFDDNKGMTVDGRADGILVAVGTEENPITMSRLGEVIWKGVWIDNSEASANRLEHVTIEYAGFSAFEDNNRAALSIGGFVGVSAINVVQCTFANSAGAGIYIKADSVVNVDIATVNTFTDNAGADII
ncbi:MAG: hypothetical protein ACNA8W_07570, partial [Bradymonadaceae bacterium]